MYDIGRSMKTNGLSSYLISAPPMNAIKIPMYLASGTRPPSLPRILKSCNLLVFHIGYLFFENIYLSFDISEMKRTTPDV